MEKLINLLNEFETPKSWIVFKSYDDYDWTFYWVDCDGETEIAWSDSLSYKGSCSMFISPHTKTVEETKERVKNFIQTELK